MKIQYLLKQGHTQNTSHLHMHLNMHLNTSIKQQSKDSDKEENFSRSILI